MLFELTTNLLSVIHRREEEEKEKEEIQEEKEQQAFRGQRPGIRFRWWVYNYIILRKLNKVFLYSSTELVFLSFRRRNKEEEKEKEEQKVIHHIRL